jgi:hypothetical protein
VNATDLTLPTVDLFTGVFTLRGLSDPRTCCGRCRRAWRLADTKPLLARLPQHVGP